MMTYLTVFIALCLAFDGIMHALNAVYYTSKGMRFMQQALKHWLIMVLLVYWMLVVQTQTVGLFIFLYVTYVISLTFMMTWMPKKDRSFILWIKTVLLEPVFLVLLLGVLLFFFHVLSPWLLVLLTFVFLGGVYGYILLKHQRLLTEKFRLVRYVHHMDEQPFISAKQDADVFMIDSKLVNLGINAMYLVIGKHAHILVSKKLLTLLNSFETEAIIVHELGHAKYKHLQKRILIGICLLFFVYLFNITNAYIYPLNGVNFQVGLELLLLNVALYWPIRSFLVFLMHKQEYQADYYCYLMGYKEPLMASLRRLYRRLDDKLYHPSYTKYYRTHPSIKARIRRLKALK